MAPKRNANRDITPSSAATTQSSTTSVGSVPSSAAPTSTASSHPSTTLNTTPARHFKAANANAKQSPAQILSNVWSHYLDETPQRTKLIDAFMAFLMVVGALQFLYCVVAGNYPFNAFLSGFGATVGQFVLTGRFALAVGGDEMGGIVADNETNSFPKDPDDRGKQVRVS
jgi:oligosaccharyltransferase complex subunit epsilon